MARYKLGYSKIPDKKVLDIVERLLVVNANILHRELGEDYITCRNKLIGMTNRGLLVVTEHKRSGGERYKKEGMVLREWRLNTDGIKQTGFTDTQ